MTQYKNLIFSILIAAFSVFSSFSFDNAKDMKNWKDTFDLEIAADNRSKLESLKQALVSNEIVKASLPKSAVSYDDADRVWNQLKKSAHGKVIFNTQDEVDQLLINVAKKLNIGIRQIGIPSTEWGTTLGNYRKIIKVLDVN